MKSRDSVRFGDTTIEYNIRRSAKRKKTVQITVDGGGVQVAAPSTAEDSRLKEIVRKRAPWILDHSSERLLVVPPKRFVSGETLPYLGRNIRMVIETKERRKPEVRFDHWRFRVSVPTRLDDEIRRDRVRRAFVNWYRRRAADRLAAAVERWWPLLGLGEKSRVLIRDQRLRWGSCAPESCAPDGTLRFNWRTVMLPTRLIEYVVVHELAHLKLKNHSADFWGLVTRVLPDAQQRRRDLRTIGQALPL